METKSETKNINEFLCLGWKYIIELAVATLIVLYAAKVLIIYNKNMKNKSKKKKTTELKELVQEVTAPPLPAPLALFKNPFQMLTITIPPATTSTTLLELAQQ